MDFSLTQEDQATRTEMFEFCEELGRGGPPELTGAPEDKWLTDEGFGHNTCCWREIAGKGWLSIDWPREYGGQGRSRICKAFLSEAMSYHRISGDAGVGIVAPTVLAFGTEEQKQRFLPGIALGTTQWCQLWSEPDAGSDLANVSTRGIREGEWHVVNGQKTWSTGAHRADWGFMLVRTDPRAKPKHRGLSYLLVDMKSPGISVRPLLSTSLRHGYNDVFFDDVRIPAENRIGEENEGWRIVRRSMNFERSGLGFLGKLDRMLEQLVAYCNDTHENGTPLWASLVIRDRLAEIACELAASRALSYRVIWMQEAGLAGSVEASAVKVRAAELNVRLAHLGNQILGPFGQVKRSGWAPLEGVYEDEYQSSMGLLLAAGTNEIQKNVIAWEGLGLPRMK